VNIEELLQKILEKPSVRSCFAVDWQQSVDTLPEQLLFFLELQKLYEWREFCGLHDDVDKHLSFTTKIIINSPELTLLIWHTYRRMYIIPDDNTNFNEWPELSNLLGSNAGVFYLIVALAMVPKVKLAHEKLSVPWAVTIDICQQISHLSDNYKRDYPGQWGVLIRQLYWLRHYPRAQIFRLGRFVYKNETKFINARVIRNKKNHQIIALARDGLKLDMAGYWRSAERLSEPGDFIATLKDDGINLMGHIISPILGSVTNEVSFYSLAEWEKVLWEGDWLLDMHYLQEVVCR
jgi:hypothetical protein